MFSVLSTLQPQKLTDMKQMQTWVTDVSLTK